MLLVIHVMQQSDSFPLIGVFPVQLGEMFHRISDCVAMFPEAFGLDPVVQDSLSAGGERFIHLNSVD